MGRNDEHIGPVKTKKCVCKIGKGNASAQGQRVGLRDRVTRHRILDVLDGLVQSQLVLLHSGVHVDLLGHGSAYLVRVRVRVRVRVLGLGC